MFLSNIIPVSNCFLLQTIKQNASFVQNGFLAEHCGLSAYPSDLFLGKRLTLQYPTAAKSYLNSYLFSQQNLQYQLICSSVWMLADYRSTDLDLLCCGMCLKYSMFSQGPLKNLGLYIKWFWIDSYLGDWTVTAEIMHRGIWEHTFLWT